jgi:hypothetical protein
MTRYPLAPLERLLTLRHGPFHGDHHTTCAVALAVGVTPRSVYRARLAGLTIWQADRYACAAGLHPALIWDNWFTEDAHDDAA